MAAGYFPGSEFEVIFENTGTAMAVIEKDMSICMVNAAFAEFWGSPREEIEGRKKWTDFISGHDLDRMKAYHVLRRREPSAAPGSYDFVAYDKSGRKRNVHLIVSMIKGTGKSIASLIDITEKKQAEESALQDSEESLRNVIDTMMDAVLIFDWDGTVLFWNRAAAQLAEVEAPRDGARANYMRFIHPDYVEKAKLNVKLLKEGGKESTLVDYKIFTRNGHVKSIECLSTRINYQGKTVGMLVARDITDRMKAEAALKHNEEFLRNVFDNMLDSILIVDWDGTILFGNNASASLVGLSSPQEGVGLNLIEFIHPEYLQKALVNLSLAREDKGGFLDEHKIITRSGQEKIVEATGRKINFGGKTADIIGLRDITQRRRAEEALRESEDLFRNLVASMQDCVMIVDPDGNILFASESTVELAEIGSAADIIGGKISLFLSDQDFEKALRNLRGGNINFLFNYRIRTARGNTKYIEGIGNKIKFRGHDALIMNLRDVTGRKRAEQALLEAYGKLQTEIEERAQAEQELSKYRSHLEEMVEERTGQLKRANRKLEREIAVRKKTEHKIKDLNMLLLSAKMITESLLRARTEEDLVRSTCTLLAELDFIKFVWAGLTEPADFTVRPLAWAGFEDGYLARVRITWDESEYGRGPTGTAIRTGNISIVGDTERDPNFSPWREQALKRGYLSVFAIPVSYRDEVMGYLTVYSGRKNAFGTAETEFLTQIAEDVAVGVKSLRLEKELESKHVELQKAYAELKASEEMVVQQEKLASIGQLAAGIAHEIKNPLAIILQGTEFMKSCVEKDEFLSDSAERIKNSANRADTIIKGLLSYSRQGGLNLDLGDISDVLNESVALVNHQLTLKNIKVLKQIEDVPRIRFDSNQMKQVFINLLMNSIESMDAGGPIEIELRRAFGDSNEILLKISDKGYGIDRESLKKIFDPFFTTKRKRGGTGLGLSITRGIIEKHKGRISVESEIGVGTAVSIYLPYDNEQGA